MSKNDFYMFSKMCRLLINYICTEDSDPDNFLFRDSDGESVETDMSGLLLGLRAFETYFWLKFKGENK